MPAGFVAPCQYKRYPQYYCHRVLQLHEKIAKLVKVKDTINFMPMQAKQKKISKSERITILVVSQSHVNAMHK